MNIYYSTIQRIFLLEFLDVQYNSTIPHAFIHCNNQFCYYIFVKLIFEN